MTNKQTEEVIKEFRKQFTLDPARVFFGDPEELRKQGWEVGKSRLIINQSTTPEEIETFILTAIKEAEDRGKETGIRQVGKWIKFPYRKGMKITKNIDGTGGLVNAGCEVCGGKLVSIRPQYPNGKKRNVCPTCATEMIESLDSNCNNRDAYTDKK